MNEQIIISEIKKFSQRIFELKAKQKLTRAEQKTLDKLEGVLVELQYLLTFKK